MTATPNIPPRSAVVVPPRPKREPVIDGLGRTVDDPAAARAIAQASKFGELHFAVHALKKQILAMAETPLGREIRVERIKNLLGEAGDVVRLAKPYTTCPLATNCSRGCKLCHGTRWITKPQYDALERGLK